MQCEHARQMSLSSANVARNLINPSLFFTIHLFEKGPCCHALKRFADQGPKPSVRRPQLPPVLPSSADNQLKPNCPQRLERGDSPTPPGRQSGACSGRDSIRSQIFDRVQQRINLADVDSWDYQRRRGGSPFPPCLSTAEAAVPREDSSGLPANLAILMLSHCSSFSVASQAISVVT